MSESKNSEQSAADRREAQRQSEDRKILAAMRKRRSRGHTAAELSERLGFQVTAARLRSMEEVHEVDKVRTGKAGRPAIIFGVQGVHEVVQDDTPSETEAVRSGEVSAQPGDPESDEDNAAAAEQRDVTPAEVE